MLSFLKLVLWGLVWAPAWGFTVMARYFKKSPRLDNCLTWALRRWEEEGGYLCIRWCRSNRIEKINWPHFLWLPPDKHQELRHFVPLSEDQGPRFLPDAWFEGKVQKGDDEDEVMEN